MGRQRPGVLTIANGSGRPASSLASLRPKDAIAVPRFRGRHDGRLQLQSRHEAVRSLGRTPTKGDANAGVGLKLTVAGNTIVPSGLTRTFSTPAVLAALAPFARSMRGCSDIPLYLV